MTEKERERLSCLEGSEIDVEVGLRNSGSSGSYLSLLKIFFESIEENEAQLNRLYNDQDIRNYTIKVHALKSSARIIGATDLGERAQGLENAGKAGDTEYIAAEHEAFLSAYSSMQGPLSALFRQKEEGEDRPEADESLMKSVYDEVLAAAEDMDCERLDSFFAEMADYKIPDGEAVLYEQLKVATGRYEYRTIRRLLKEKQTS